jgi:hypothetical protein
MSSAGTWPFIQCYGMPLSAILWQSVLLVEETGEPGEKNTDLSQVTDKLYTIFNF